MRKYLNLRANIALGLIFAFLVNTLGPVPFVHADELRLPAPGMIVHLSPAFDAPVLKGIKVHPENPFQFEFILDQGDEKNTSHPERSEGSLKEQSIRLIKYFLASLTIPEKDLWVNLSPYEKNRIIPQSFGLTEMGRDLLAEDYMLKQITASLVYPEDEIGKKFWKRIYSEAAKKFGTTNIPVSMFNKVWIVPDKAVVYENAKAGTAYVVESRLKVMLEQDYLARSRSVIASVAKQSVNNLSALGSQIVREIVIPQLTKEVNEGQNFAQLRQVYNSLILATWYKKRIRDSILAEVYENKTKTKGLLSLNGTVQNPEQIYQRYLQAFKKGTYNYIKEEQDLLTRQIVPKKYFSGGFGFAGRMGPAMEYTSDDAMLSQKMISTGFLTLYVSLSAIMPAKVLAQNNQASPSAQESKQIEKEKSIRFEDGSEIKIDDILNYVLEHETADLRIYKIKEKVRVIQIDKNPKGHILTLKIMSSETPLRIGKEFSLEISPSQWPENLSSNKAMASYAHATGSFRAPVKSRFDPDFIAMTERILRNGIKNISPAERLRWAQDYFKGVGIVVRNIGRTGLVIEPNADPASGYAYFAYKLKGLSVNPQHEYQLIYSDVPTTHKEIMATLDTDRRHIYIGFGSLLESLGVTKDITSTNTDIIHEAIHAWFEEIIKKGGNSFLSSSVVSLKKGEIRDYYDKYFISNEMLTQLFNVRQAIRNLFLIPRNDNEIRTLVRFSLGTDLESPFKEGLSLFRARRMSYIQNQMSGRVMHIFEAHRSAGSLYSWKGWLKDSEEGFIYSDAHSMDAFDENHHFQILITTRTRNLDGRPKKFVYISSQLPATGQLLGGNLTFEVDDPVLAEEITQAKEKYKDGDTIPKILWGKVINNAHVNLILGQMHEFTAAVLNLTDPLEPFMEHSWELVKEYRALDNEVQRESKEDEIIAYWQNNIHTLYNLMTRIEPEILNQVRSVVHTQGMLGLNQAMASSHDSDEGPFSEAYVRVRDYINLSIYTEGQDAPQFFRKILDEFPVSEGSDPMQLIWMIEILSQQPDSIRFLDVYWHAVSSPSRFIRLAAIEAAGRLEDSRANKILLKGVRDTDTRIAEKALSYLDQSGIEENIPELMKILGSLPEETVFYIYDDHGSRVAYTEPSEESNLTTQRFKFDHEETQDNFIKQEIKKIISNIRERSINERRSKRVDISGIKDETLRDFFQWLERNDLKDIVVMGGGVRDVLLGRQLSDFDITIALPLRDEEYYRSLSSRYQANIRIIIHVHQRLEALAKALGVKVQDFFDPDKHILWHGKEIQYAGPIVKTDINKKPVFIKRALVDSNSLGLFSSSPGPSVLQMALDCHGQLYGHVEAIEDLKKETIRIIGNIDDYSVGGILRAIRLQVEFGQQLTEHDRNQLKEVIKNFMKNKRYLRDPILNQLSRKQLLVLAKVYQEGRAKSDPMKLFREVGLLPLFEAIGIHDLNELFANRHNADQLTKSTKLDQAMAVKKGPIMGRTFKSADVKKLWRELKTAQELTPGQLPEKYRGMTQKEMSLATSVSPGKISALLNGARMESIGMTQRRIAREKVFQPYESLRELFMNPDNKEIWQKGWWIAFDVDRTKDIGADRVVLDAVLRNLNQIIFESFELKEEPRTQFYGTWRDKQHPEKEEGYIHIPRDDVSKDSIEAQLTSIRARFEKRTQKTVTFAVMKANLIESAVENSSLNKSLRNFLFVMQKTLAVLLRSGKGKKEKILTPDYGNKTIFYEPSGEAGDQAMGSPGYVPALNPEEIRSKFKNLFSVINSRKLVSNGKLIALLNRVYFNAVLIRRGYDLRFLKANFIQFRIYIFIFENIAQENAVIANELLQAFISDWLNIAIPLNGAKPLEVRQNGKLYPVHRSEVIRLFREEFIRVFAEEKIKIRELMEFNRQLAQNIATLHQETLAMRESSAKADVDQVSVVEETSVPSSRNSMSNHMDDLLIKIRESISFGIGRWNSFLDRMPWRRATQNPIPDTALQPKVPLKTVKVGRPAVRKKEGYFPNEDTLSIMARKSGVLDDFIALLVTNTHLERGDVEERLLGAATAQGRSDLEDFFHYLRTPINNGAAAAHSVAQAENNLPVQKRAALDIAIYKDKRYVVKTWERSKQEIVDRLNHEFSAENIETIRNNSNFMYIWAAGIYRFKIHGEGDVEYSLYVRYYEDEKKLVVIGYSPQTTFHSKRNALRPFFVDFLTAFNHQNPTYKDFNEKTESKDVEQLQNRAQLASTGGIDLTSVSKDLQAQKSGEIKFHLDSAMLQQLRDAPGVVPVIISIMPMMDLKKFLEAT
jgi:hypothetical protein